MTVAVVHLVANEEGSLARFLTSYRAHAAGIEHELVLVANRWTGVLSDRQRELVSPYRLLDVDALYDLDAYREAAQTLSAEQFCFLSSYTTVIADGWLRALIGALNQPGVGLAGTTASHESHLGSYLTAPQSGPPKKMTAGRLVRGLVNLGRLRLQYDGFPNPHIRTSAFAIAGDLFREIPMPPLRTKADAERMESGKRGLTRAVEQRGYAVVVTGRDGAAYSKGRFRESHTFRIGEQCNLLIADNRTVQYANASERERRLLRKIAWGDDADVRCPRCW